MRRKTLQERAVAAVPVCGYGRARAGPGGDAASVSPTGLRFHVLINNGKTDKLVAAMETSGCKWCT